MALSARGKDIWMMLTLFVIRLVRRDLWRDEAVVESDWAGL